MRPEESNTDTHSSYILKPLIFALPFLDTVEKYMLASQNDSEMNIYRLTTAGMDVTVNNVCYS